MPAKRDQDGFSKAKATDVGFSKSREVGDDDVEGHRFIHARDDFSKAKATVDGFSKSREAGDDDVEGHSMSINPLVARELARARERDVQANVKRHNFENDARAAKKDRG
jgi:hypothetical protein